MPEDSTTRRLGAALAASLLIAGPAPGLAQSSPAGSVATAPGAGGPGSDQSAVAGEPPEAIEAPSAWINAPDVQAQLAAGQVVAHTVVDDRQARASVDAVIRIHASPSQVWPLITQCRSAGLLIPGLKGCRVLDSAADGSWATIEHEIKYSVFTPLVHSVFHADMHAPYRMDFHRISGDLKYEVGSWILLPDADGSTTVEYRVAMQPGFWVPRSMVRHSLRRQLPAALIALRSTAEQSAPASAVAPAAVADTTATAGTAPAASPSP
jgi:hypothetical protein